MVTGYRGMADALNIYAPDELERNPYAEAATRLLADHGGVLDGIITGVRSRPDQQIQYYENGWIVTYDDRTVYLTGLTLCEPDPFWDTDPDPVTATVFTPEDAETPRQRYDRAYTLEQAYNDPHRDDDDRAALLNAYDARFITATPDVQDSLAQILAFLDEDGGDDARHVQLGNEHWSRFDRPTASTLLEAQYGTAD